MTTLHPVPGYILVEPATANTQSSSGLAYQEDTRAVGKVLAIGEKTINEFGTELYPPPIKVGDTIIYDRMAPMDLSWRGTRYLFIHFRDVRGVDHA